MADLAVRRADAREIAEHWATIEPLFASALPVALGRFEPIDLLMLCINGSMTPWFAVDAEGEIYAVMLTTIVTYPRCKECSVFLVAGTRMEEWLDVWSDAIEQHARANGCHRLEAAGRPGWERVTGARRGAVQIIKELR